MSQANARHTYLLRIQSVKTELNKRENGRVISDVGKSDALASQKASSSCACKTTSEEIKMKLLCHLDFDQHLLPALGHVCQRNVSQETIAMCRTNHTDGSIPW